MFEEDMAANVEDFDLTPPEEIEEQPTSPVEPVVEKEINSTKAYSERLNKDRERIRQEERDNIANSFGYDNWAEYLKAQTDSSLLEKGLDPEQIRPIIKDAIKNDPDYIEAMKIKQEKEQLEAKIWADDELKRLNEKFSLRIKSVDDLDEDVQNMWKSGISLEKAYAANHYEELRTAALKKSREISDGKSHLKDANEGNNISAKTISKEQMKYFKALNPNATEDQIKAYINRK